jgi:alkylation response protein AidB-like acyl-CoA dehydrogenase
MGWSTSPTFDSEALRAPRREDAEMDFRLGEKAEAVKREIRSFLEREFSEEARNQERIESGGHNWPLYRKLAAEGWVSAAWPEEYGGAGRDPYEMLALYWELCKDEFPWIGLMNSGFIGHTLMALGTEDQKKEIVPRIAAGEVVMALGYSEPDAGSDVAAARCGARRDGDDWIIDGQKMWTTTAHEAQYIFMLTRTSVQEKRHHGLTMFLVPTDAKGVDIQAVHTMGNERTNAVYMSEVQISDSLRVGEVDKGWAVVRFALGLEQAMGFADKMEAFVEEAAEWAGETRADGSRPLDDLRVKEQLGQAAINAEVAKLLRHRATWRAAEGHPLGAEGAMSKAFSAGSYLADSQAWMDLVGPTALLERSESESSGSGIFEETYRNSPVTTIYGGTIEILRSLIAEVGLGLPKSR